MLCLPQRVGRHLYADRLRGYLKFIASRNSLDERIAAAGKLWKRLAPKGYAMKEAELKVDLAVMGDEVIGTIRMTGPLYCHVEFAAALIREISKDSGVPVHQVLADIGRVL